MYESNPRVPIPPRADPRVFDTFYFFGQIPHHEVPFFGQMPPQSNYLLGVKYPPPKLERQIQIDFWKSKRVFQHCLYVGIQHFIHSSILSRVVTTRAS